MNHAMQQRPNRSNIGGGYDTGFPHTPGNGEGRTVRSGGAFDMSGVNVGATLLNPDLKKVFKSRTKDTLMKVRKSNIEEIQAAAENFARQKKFILQTKAETNKDLAGLINELNKKSDTDDVFHIRKDDKGNLHLFHKKYYSEYQKIYVLEITSTNEFEKEFGQLVRRFLSTFANKVGIPFINETFRFQGEYEYRQDVAEDMRYQLEAKHCTEEDVKDAEDALELYKSYKEGDICQRLKEFKELPEISKDEIKAYEPKNEKEKELKSVMAEGFKFMTDDFDIHEYEELNYDEIKGDGQEVYITTEDILVIAYEDDDVWDSLVESINQSASSGGEDESFCTYEELKPKGKIKDEKLISQFFPYMERLANSLYKITN